jgi:hypothetical protein
MFNHQQRRRRPDHPSGTPTPSLPIAVLLDVVAPVASYYGLRAAGVSVYLALVAGAIGPGISTTVGLIRGRAADGLAVFVVTTMLLGLGVSLVTGSPRFVLAKEGWVTAVGAVWFLASARTRRPLAFRFARSLLEGRPAFTGESWDSIWQRNPGFRRLWRVSSVIWGAGLLADAGIRVVIAYTLPIDLVPAIAAALYPVTFLVLQVLDQITTDAQASGDCSPSGARPIRDLIKLTALTGAVTDPFSAPMRRPLRSTNWRWHRCPRIESPPVSGGSWQS